MENKKGSVKTRCGRLIIRDFHVSKIIVDALVEKGYEIISNPTLNEYNNVIEDTIDIYRISEHF